MVPNAMAKRACRRQPAGHNVSRGFVRGQDLYDVHLARRC